MPKRKTTIKEMQLMAKEREGKCLSKEYTNSTTKLEWECKNGHKWFETLAKIKNGSWCRKCTKQKKLLIYNQSKEIARSKDGICLSKKFTNLSTKLEWECKNGHRWFTTPRSIINGHWCGKCAYDQKKCTLKQMQEIANLKGGKCLSKEYINITTKLEWECKNGHKWFETLARIKNGSWCVECNKQKKILIYNKLNEIARSKGGKCLSKGYKNTTTKLEWECEKGHQWFAPSVRIIKGHWCHKCFLERRKKTKITKKT